MSRPSEEPEDRSKATAPTQDLSSGKSLDFLPDMPLASISDLASAIDTLAHPLMALFPEGLLLHANQAARELLAQDQTFVLGPDQHVSPRSVQYRSPFIAALQAASAGVPQQLHWADGPLGLHVTLRPLGTPVAGTPAPPVLLMLAPPEDTPFDAIGFASTYGLSAAETRVLEALLHGHKAEQAADRLGVGVATVRSQIAAIRKKTGHRSVASLLAALGELPPLRKPAQR